MAKAKKKEPVKASAKPASKKSKDVCKSCSHSGEKHYGSEERWCNEAGCSCLGIVS